MRIGPSSSSAPPPKPSAAVPAAEPALLRPEKKSVSGVARTVRDRIRAFFKPFQLLSHPALPTPPDRGGLKIVSYNIMNGGQRLAQVERYLREAEPDVICLQESSREAVEQLAKRLGLHAVYNSGRLGVHGQHHAILSRYPIAEARPVKFKRSWRTSLGMAWDKLRHSDNKFWAVEALQSRNMLQATLQVGSRKVTVLDTHLSLKDPGSNATQLDQLAAAARRFEAQGHTVLVAGDFNTNFALAGQGRADARGRIETPTDTVAEFKDRYQVGAGNIANPADKAAIDRLLTGLQHHWQAERRAALVDGQLITPEEAQRQLQSGTVAAGSDRHRQLLQVMDGITQLGGRKRFDNILASRDVRLVAAEVDQSATGSDHQPVRAEVRWD